MAVVTPANISADACWQYMKITTTVKKKKNLPFPPSPMFLLLNFWQCNSVGYCLFIIPIFNIFFSLTCIQKKKKKKVGGYSLDLAEGRQLSNNWSDHLFGLG